MGAGSTQFQHHIQTEVPPKLLKEWIDIWRKHHGVDGGLTVSLRPHSAGSQLLELSIVTSGGEKAANVVFEPIHDRHGHSILSIRDQNTFDMRLRRKRLMTLAQLFLIHRYKIDSIHYLTPSEDNHRQTERMRAQGIFSSVHDEVGQIIVSDVDKTRIMGLLEADRVALSSLITSGK
jgi:isocitrate lyase